MRFLPDHAWTVCTFFAACVGIVSWLSEATGVGPATTFVAVSNLGFVTTLFAISLLARLYLSQLHPLVYEGMAATILTGSSSWAFHTDGALRTPAHALDIAMGWNLHVYLATLCLYAAMPRQPATWRVLLALNLLRAIALCVLFHFYDAVKPHQIYVYLACGGVQYASKIRMDVSRRGARKWCHAAAESLSLAFLQFVAGTLQGELWFEARGERWYNVSHGYWHILNALITAVLVMQCARRMAESDEVVEAATRYMEARSRVAACTFAGVLWAVALLDTEENEPNAAFLIICNVVLLLATGVPLLALWREEAARAATFTDDGVV